MPVKRILRAPQGDEVSRFDPLFKPFFTLYVAVSVVLLLLGLGPALAKAVPAVQVYL